ncbi:hypothetical protein M426DRAFT_260631 [Hypoxylon sp. CI-4A]|nr:hypothetical protein M426DRAFT_260631 [Hypoxylon sp. CI-4A]
MDLAAASVGFASLAFQLFNRCVEGIALFNTAQHIGEDGGLFRAGQEFGKYRLITWASKAGLLEDGIEQSSRVSWQLATMFLEQLSALVTSADKLRKRLKLEIYTISGQIIQANNGAMKRLRWASVGRDRAKRIISDVYDLIDKLEYLLDSADREERHAEDRRLLRSLISLTSTATEVGDFKEMLGDKMSLNSGEISIRAAAYVKQIRLTLGADRRDDEVQPISTAEIRSIMPQLKVIKRTLKVWTDGGLRLSGIEFARYSDKQVIIQWKVTEGQLWSLIILSFLASKGSQNEDFLRSEPLVMGYDYARPDTADAAASFTQLPDNKLVAELYRHPQARGQARETYQKRFDLYALGCLFVELVFWQSMVDIHAKFTTNDLAEKIAKADEPGGTVIDVPSLDDLLKCDEAVEGMKHQAGEQMFDIISTCCHAKKVENGQEISLDEQLSIVEKLARCSF